MKNNKVIFMKSDFFDLSRFFTDKFKVNTRRVFTLTLLSFFGHFEDFLQKLKVRIFAFI